MNVATTCGPHKQDPHTGTGLLTAGLETMLWRTEQIYKL